MNLFAQALAWLEDGRGASFATVVSTDGSVPRHRGARMLVADDGSTVATIGGGRVEKEVVDVAVAVARGDTGAAVVKHHLVRDLAMCCGGAMHILVEPAGRSAEVLAQARAAIDAREPFTLSSSVEKPMTIRAGAERRTSSWDGRELIEPRWPAERAIVFGAGHVARALLGPLRALGFETVVCDDNELGAAGRVAGEVDRVVESFELFDVERAIGRLGVGDFALILTRDHAVDQRLVEQLLGRPALSYVGLIGSLGKVGRFRKRLLARGNIDQATWDRLSAPIGLDIDAETPAEIAVSIAAALVQTRAALRRDDS